MATRKRDLAPDSQGRYRPRIGYVLYDGVRQQPRFNLGTDRKEAERRYAIIQALYEESLAAEYDGALSGDRPDFWDPVPTPRGKFDSRPPRSTWGQVGLLFARQIEQGDRTVVLHPTLFPTPFRRPAYDGSGVEAAPRTTGLNYAQSLAAYQAHFPSVHIRPGDPELYSAGLQENEQIVKERLQILEGHLRKEGLVIGPTSVPEVLIRGSLHEALDAYARHIRQTGATLTASAGVLKPYHRLRLKRVERLKSAHADVPLHALGYDWCAEAIGTWRNRPLTRRGTSSSADNSRHHISELKRFLTWLNSTQQYQWSMPRGFDSIPTKVERLTSERKLSAITKHTYTPEQLATLNRHATPLERLALYLSLNCAFGAAELGRLEVGDFRLSKRHPHADRLRFSSTDADSFVMYHRPKTGVYGEWLIWPPVAEMVSWAIERAARLKTTLLFAWDSGTPMYVESSANPQSGFANTWRRLLDRVRKSRPDFPMYPFGSMRDTLPDVIRRDYSGELASMCLAHGNPCTADNLLEVYSNKPFGRLHEAVRGAAAQFAEVFAAVSDPLADAKHYLPVELHQRIVGLIAQGVKVTQIARQCGVSRQTVYRLREG